VACARFPAVAEHLAWLKQLAPQAMMTGSGACVFAGFAERSDEAEAVFAGLPAGMNAWLADGLPEHPLAKIQLKKRLDFRQTSAPVLFAPRSNANPFDDPLGSRQVGQGTGF
jgi:hypothetical protein